MRIAIASVVSLLVHLGLLVRHIGAVEIYGNPAAPASSFGGRRRRQRSAVAVRPSRLQIAAARLSLLLHGKEGRLPIGLAVFAIGAGLSVAGLEFLRLVLSFGLVDAIRVSAGGIAALTLASIAGALALLLHASRGAEPLSQDELEGGVLLQIGPEGLAATVRGATTYYDWEHVALHRMAHGIVFVLPRRTFHLLPYSAVGADDARRLRKLLGSALGARPPSENDRRPGWRRRPLLRPRPGHDAGAHLRCRR